MSLMDFTLDAPAQQPSVEVQHTSSGYRVREAKIVGWRVQTAAALVASGDFSLRCDEIEVDLKGRVLHIASRGRHGVLRSRKTLRFEEITRIDLAETGLMSELRSAITRLDYATITLSAHGGRAIKIIGGDMMDLEPLLSRLRGDTGVA